MKLTTKNLMKFLKSRRLVPPCKEGMAAFKKLLKQKKSMEYVFNRLNSMRRREPEITYAQWAYNQLYYCVTERISGMEIASFKDFKRLFKKLPDYP